MWNNYILLHYDYQTVQYLWNTPNVYKNYKLLATTEMSLCEFITKEKWSIPREY